MEHTLTARQDKMEHIFTARQDQMEQAFTLRQERLEHTFTLKQERMEKSLLIKMGSLSIALAGLIFWMVERQISATEKQILATERHTKALIDYTQDQNNSRFERWEEAFFPDPKKQQALVKKTN